MALAYTYLDPYLSPLVNSSIEDQAVADIGIISSDFSQAWLNVLVPLRVYIIICMRSQTDEADTFSTKLATYRQEFKTQLDLAKANTTSAATGLTLNTMTFRVDRG